MNEGIRALEYSNICTISNPLNDKKKINISGFIP